MSEMRATLFGWTVPQWRIVAAYHLLREKTLPAPSDLDVVFDKFIDEWYADGGSCEPENPKPPVLNYVSYGDHTSAISTLKWEPAVEPIEIPVEVKAWVSLVWWNARSHIK